MDLPVFQDNLRSSSGWLAELEREKGVWIEIMARDGDRVRDSIRVFAGDQMEPALDLVSHWAREEQAALSVARLRELHTTLKGEDEGLRQVEAKPFIDQHDPAPPGLLLRFLENAFDWFSTPSFNEIHPVEQASLVLLRLRDLEPFPSLNDETALCAASFYTERAGFPPLIIFDDADTQARYRKALEAAFRMLTQPLVEFLAEMLTRTIRTVSK
jgi:hypothetical protein